MGYYARVFVEDSRGITIKELQEELRRSDSKFAITEEGDLLYGDDLLAEIEISIPEEPLFQDEIAEFKDEVSDERPKTGDLRRVQACLDATTAIVRIRILCRSWEKLRIVWVRLLEIRTGLVQWDEEGFGDASEDSEHMVLEYL